MADGPASQRQAVVKGAEERNKMRPGEKEEAGLTDASAPGAKCKGKGMSGAASRWGSQALSAWHSALHRSLVLGRTGEGGAGPGAPGSGFWSQLSFPLHYVLGQIPAPL